jgi:hypothetical protein
MNNYMVIKKRKIDLRLNITPRETFQKIGTEFGQYIIHELLPNLNIEKRTLWTQILDNVDKSKNIVISDVRFQHEINAIKKMEELLLKLIEILIKIYLINTLLNKKYIIFLLLI